MALAKRRALDQEKNNVNIIIMIALWGFSVGRENCRKDRCEPCDGCV